MWSGWWGFSVCRIPRPIHLVILLVHQQRSQNQAHLKKVLQVTCITFRPLNATEKIPWTTLLHSSNSSKRSDTSTAILSLETTSTRAEPSQQNPNKDDELYVHRGRLQNCSKWYDLHWQTSGNWIETLSSFVADEDENDRKSYFTFSSECACLKFRFRFCGVVEDGRCQCFSLWWERK